MINELGNWEFTFRLGWGIVYLIVWELIWKGLALYRAGKKQQPWWFFFLLIINSVGILPIIYLILSQDKKAVSGKKRRK